MTSKGSGLHLTMSVPGVDLSESGFSRNKFLLLLGEDYYARLFGRENYHYAADHLRVVCEKMADYLTTNKVSITLDDCRSALVNAVQLQAQFGSDLHYTSEVSSHLALLLMSATSANNRTNSVNTTKLSGSKSRIELRLPGGAGYENKLDACSRLIYLMANAITASLIGTNKYDEYVAKKLLRYILRAKGAKGASSDTLANKKIKTSQSSDRGTTVYQTVVYGRSPVQGLVKAPVITVAFKGDVLSTFTYTPTPYDDEEAVVASFLEKAQLNDTQLLSLFEYNYANYIRISIGQVLDSDLKKALGIENTRASAYEGIPRLTQAVEACSQATQKTLLARFVLRYFLCGSADFVTTPYGTTDTVLPAGDSNLRVTIGRLVQLAKLGKNDLNFFKFYVFGKVPSDLTMLQLEKVPGRGGERIPGTRIRSYLRADPILRPLAPKLFNLLVEDYASPGVVALRDTVDTCLIPGVAKIGDISEGGIQRLRHALDSATSSTYNLHSIFRRVYEALGKSGFLKIYSPILNEKLSAANATEPDSGLDVFNGFVKFAEGNDEATLGLKALITEMVSKPNISMDANVTVSSILSLLDTAKPLTISQVVQIAESAADADIQPYKSDAVFATRLVISATCVTRRRIALKVNPVLAKEFKTNPVWSAALLAIAAGATHLGYGHPYYLFGLKPEVFVKTALSHFPNNARYLRIALDTVAKHKTSSSLFSFPQKLDVNSFINSLPPLPLEVAFGKRMLDFLFQITAMKLAASSPYYAFRGYRSMETYTDVLPPLLDYLVGQTLKGKHLIGITDVNYRPGSADSSKLGPYSGYKISKEEAVRLQGLLWSNSQGLTSDVPQAQVEPEVAPEPPERPDGTEIVTATQVRQRANQRELVKFSEQFLQNHIITQDELIHLCLYGSARNIVSVLDVLRDADAASGSAYFYTSQFSVILRRRDVKNPALWYATKSILTLWDPSTYKRAFDIIAVTIASVLGGIAEDQMALAAGATFAGAPVDKVFAEWAPIANKLGYAILQSSGKNQAILIILAAYRDGVADAAFKALTSTRSISNMAKLLKKIAYYSKKTDVQLESALSKNLKSAAKYEENIIKNVLLGSPKRSPLGDFVLRSIGRNAVAELAQKNPNNVKYPWREAI